MKQNMKDLKMQKFKFAYKLQFVLLYQVFWVNIERAIRDQTSCHFSGLCDKPLLPRVSGFQIYIQIGKKAACSEPTTSVGAGSD